MDGRQLSRVIVSTIFELDGGSQLIVTTSGEARNKNERSIEFSLPDKNQSLRFAWRDEAAGQKLVGDQAYLVSINGGSPIELTRSGMEYGKSGARQPQAERFDLDTISDLRTAISSIRMPVVSNFRDIEPPKVDGRPIGSVAMTAGEWGNCVKDFGEAVGVFGAIGGLIVTGGSPAGAGGGAGVGAAVGGSFGLGWCTANAIYDWLFD